MAGAADGSIMAAIINHHMTTSAPKGGVRIAPIAAGLPAVCAATYHQPSAVSATSVAATSARSCRRMRLVRSGGADDTVAGQVQVRKLRVFAVDLDIHRSADGAARCAADVSDLIFEAVGKYDLRPGFGAGDRVADRLAGHFHITGDGQAALPSGHVHLEFDRRKHRLVERRDRARKYREDGGERVRVLAAHDLEN